MKNETPKVFISYSRTSDVYASQILEIARLLRENGVDVIFDKWHLKPGMDLNYFMESGITEADKVLVFCDKRYQTKANNREGGVGTETIIITPEVYGNAMETKFIPVIMEKDGYGKPCFPIYLRSRFGLDFVDNFEADFRILIRELFDEPEYKEPPIGKPPAWLKSTNRRKPQIVKFQSNKSLFEYPQTSIYAYGPSNDVKIEITGEAAEHFGSYEQLHANIRYNLQLVSHAIIQLQYEVGDNKYFPIENIWLMKIGDQLGVYTSDMMTVMNCTFYEDSVIIDFFSTNQIMKVQPLLDYAENHARLNGRIANRSIP